MDGERAERGLRRLDRPLAVEQLVFEVRPDAWEAWEAADHELWTLAESERFPFLVAKEVWLERGDPYRVTVVIYWDDLDAWKAIDPAWIEAQERAFAERVGRDNYRLVDAPHERHQAFKITEFRAR